MQNDLRFPGLEGLIRHRRFSLNRRGLDFVVGDIHGEYPRLERAMERVGFDRARDRLFAVGDLVDRGPASEAVLALLEEDWFFSVLGNHEMMLLEGLSDPEAGALHLMNGGAWFRELPAAQQQRLAQRIRDHCSLALTIETDQGSVGLIHATAPDDWRQIEDQRLGPDDWQVLLWDRHDFQQARVRPGLSRPVRGVRFTVHGHVSCGHAGRAGNRCWIDTLYRGGDLTLIPLNELSILRSP